MPRFLDYENAISMEAEGYLTLEQYGKKCDRARETILRAIGDAEYAEFYARRKQARTGGKHVWMIKLADVLKYRDSKKSFWKE